MKVPFDKSGESFFELLVSQSVAKGVDRGVSITEKICKVVHMSINTTTKGFNHGQDMIRCPGTKAEFNYYFIKIEFG